jgi:hypothetical protein
MHRVGFEVMPPVLERANTVHALDRAATVIGLLHFTNLKKKNPSCFFNLSCILVTEICAKMSQVSRACLLLSEPPSFLYRDIFPIKIVNLPITVAARFKAWIVFVRSDTRIVSSNLTRGMSVCVYCLCCSVYAATLWQADHLSKEFYRVSVWFKFQS